MNLDDLAYMQQLDTDHMLRHIDGLPDQFEAAWHHAQTLPLPASVRQVALLGMGGSAIGGDLLAAYLAGRSKVAVSVVRGYDLPAWVHGQETLVIASSFSGNTEETLAAYDQALARDVQVLGMTTGGKLAQQLAAHNHLAWTFSTDIGHPRAAIGWSFGLLLALAARAGWAEGIEADLKDAIATLKAYRERYAASVPAATNHAKRQAGQFIGRVPVFIGAGIFEPIARRWKGQLNENSKVWAMFDVLPEMNHNTVVGIEFPQEVLGKLAVMFIASPQYDHPRVALRHQLTQELFLTSGIMTDRFEPVGDNPLTQMLHAIQFGDYLSYYTAMAYGADPAVIMPIQELKAALANL
ncbi:MAG: bifunctional phosphoglucose/phosphomannose isomerase [Anaerolineales bacterium]|nr:bifunctional phosphoglucose/phosphomannose isomerase [Anaerolineales bacterium]